MDHISLIGVGFIGKTFVDELRDDGYPLTVYDIDESQLDYAVERGVTTTESAKAVADATDIVLIAVVGTPEIEDVMEEDGGILDRLEPGQLVIDTTTTLPDTAAYEATCADRGVGFVSAPLTRDAPVGGVHMMVGGTEANYEAATEILDGLSENHTRIGDIENGLRFK